jgi:hypothetical protein
MPKKPSDRVETVRFELQDKERELAEGYLMTWQVGKMADSIDKLSSFENLYVIVTLIEMITGKELLPGTPNDVADLMDALKGDDYALFGVDEEGNVVKTPRTGGLLTSLGSYYYAVGGTPGMVSEQLEATGIPGAQTLFDAWWGLSQYSPMDAPVWAGGDWYLDEQGRRRRRD